VHYCDVGLVDLRKIDILRPDLLIVLGGPIGAYEEARYPFLKEELALIEKRIKRNLPTLGICLGAQLMAHASGARVYPTGIKEIGFMPITLTAAGRRSCLAPFIEQPMALHWHGDSFDLPRGASLLASTKLCQNQAFALAPHIVGFQFHPEASGERLEPWLIGHAAELTAAGVDIHLLRREAKGLAPGLKAKAKACLENFLSRDAGLLDT
jgi:GMP synthase (glutamine-hydrolysing)